MRTPRKHEAEFEAVEPLPPHMATKSFKLDAAHCCNYKKMMPVPSSAEFMASSSMLLVNAHNNGMRATMAKVKQILGHSFQDLRLLEEVLTHQSHAEHPSYQQLKFTGDTATLLDFTMYTSPTPNISLG
ncbi:hypothetical protein COCNU_07G009640 [Cocos nucifera]|uniref:RNase III domain-containing protein n=1 Tax=Cocos nucifera TaxID=13894 RepID=A0A8K0IFT0_COCNU|nr:hypothetical protein COCNU_07G009640 [Cocos nucifera]